MDRTAQKSRVALLSVISNTLLVGFKLVVGFAIGSVSIMSEAIHSAVDLLAALIALVAVRKSDKPADQGHPFGHGKIENISGAVEALLIFVAAGWIIYEASQKLLAPHPIEQLGWGVGVMAISALANWIVSRRLFQVGRATESIALQADGWHLRTDVYTSVGVMAALTAILLGRHFLPGWNLDWLDPATALAVALLICHAAWKLTVQSVRDLLDSSLPAEEQRWLHDYLSGHGPDIHGYHRLRTRRAGTVRFIELDLQVDPTLSVTAAHRLAHAISDGITAKYPDANVTIHVEPDDDRPQ